jgi:hypothetical protein
LEFCLEDGVGVLEGQPESREVGLVGWGGKGGLRGRRRILLA